MQSRKEPVPTSSRGPITSMQHSPVLSSFCAITLFGACAQPEPTTMEDSQGLLEEIFDQLPNSFPIRDEAGFAASFHGAGFVDLSNNFFTPQGSNGRDCGSCHVPEDGWSIKP